MKKSLFKKFIFYVISFLVIFSSIPTKSFAFAKDSVGSTRPKVSVIIPVYKVEPWLRECMDSVVNQTLKEIEIICVDDGSPDNCGKILDEYAAKDNRITVIHQKNQGVSGARNSGLEIASGEYITFVDPDDYLNLNTYKVAYELAKKDDVDIFQFGFRRFDDGKDVPPLQLKILDTPVINMETAIYKIHDISCNKLYKAELIQKSKLRFLPEKTFGEDAIFSIIILSYSKKIKIIQAKMYNYRQRLSSAIHKKDRKDIYRCIIDNFKPVYDEWRKNGKLIRNEHLLINRFIHSIMYSNMRFQYAKEILSAFGDDIYKPKIIRKCSKRVQDEIKKLKNIAEAQLRI